MEIVDPGATWRTVEGGMKDDDDVVFRAACFWLRPQWQRDQEAESASRFSREAEQEMLRIIVDVQQNRNRPEDLP